MRKHHVQAVLDAHAAAEARSPSPPKAEPGREPRSIDEVDHLLASFGVSSRSEHAQRNELKALVGLEPTPPPPGSDQAHEGGQRPARESDVESLLAISDSAPPPVAAGRRGLASPPTAISRSLAREPYAGASRGQPGAVTASAPTPPESPQSHARAPRERSPRASEPGEGRSSNAAIPTAPSARRLAEMGSRPTLDPRPADRSLTVFALVILALGGVAIWVLRPALLGGNDAHPAASAPASTSAAPPVATAPKCRASLAVTGAPSNAEILVRAGQAPVDVEKMPVGPRLSSSWQRPRGMRRSGRLFRRGPRGTPGPTVSPGMKWRCSSIARARAWRRLRSVAHRRAGERRGGKGAPGTVHLVTTPRGAEVWQLAALGPEAEFDVRCGGEVEVLIAGPTLRKRLRVAESEFVSLDGGADRRASVGAGAGAK